MNKTQSILIAAALALSTTLGASAAFPVLTGKVTKVSDGDTIGFLPNKAEAGAKPLSIRVTSMDTAELHLPTGSGGQASQGYWGEQGKLELASMIRVGDTVKVENQGTDSYGRVLGRILLRKKDINLEMVRSGWGALYIICDGTKPCPIMADYRNACLDAVKGERGLFDAKRPVPELPFIFRSRVQKRPLVRPVGHAKKKIYVAPNDWKKIPICDRVFFSSEKVAKDAGFKKAP